jgi:hypothetical protein
MASDPRSACAKPYADGRFSGSHPNLSCKLISDATPNGVRDCDPIDKSLKSYTGLASGRTYLYSESINSMGRTHGRDQ